MTFLERERDRRLPYVAPKRISLINRLEEMKALKGAVDKTVRGEGGIIFLSGEAGIGKTRLTRELGTYANFRGMQVLYGKCPSLFKMDGIYPYVLWREVIRDYLEKSSPDQLYRVIGLYPEEVAKLVPELRQRFDTIPQSFPITPEQEQNRLFEAVTQFVTNISRETPLLVVLDDLQWVDSSSLLLLHYLARGANRTPLLLLGAYRNTDIDLNHPLTPILIELNRERLLQSVTLKRMSLDDISGMIKQILEQDDIPAEFCNRVFEKTRGNPFFAEEVINSLKEDELIYREGNRWKVREAMSIELPLTVKSVVENRISRLNDECRSILTKASFIGNDFSFEALQEVSGFNEGKLLELTDIMLKTGLIKQKTIRGESVCSFADTLIRDVLCEDVSPFRRSRLHDIVGCALEKVYASRLDEHLGELAFHFLESGNEDKALNYLIRAGEKSQEMYAYEEALSYFSQVLNFLEEREASVKERARIAEKLGDIKTWTGKFDAGFDYWTKALRFLTQTHDMKSISALHIKMAHAFWSIAGDKTRASEHHQIALEILEREPGNIELAGLYEDIGHRLWRSGEPGASSWLKKGLALAEKLGDSRVLAECYDDLGAATIGDLEKTKRYWEKGLKIAVESNSHEAALRLYCNLSELYWLIGEPERALETVQKGLELAKKVGDLNLFVWLNGNLASSYSSMGDILKALKIQEDDLALAQRTENISHVPMAMLSIGECHLRLGEWEKSSQYLTEAVIMSKRVQEFESSALAMERLGELLTEMDNLEEAEKCFAEGCSICEKGGEKTGLFFEIYPNLSRLYLKEGALEKAETLIAKISEFAAETQNKVLCAIAEMLQGMLLGAKNDWEQSIKHFERSFQTFKDLNAQKWYTLHYGRILYEYGSTLLRRDRMDDGERARDLLARALEVFRKRGAKKDIEKLEQKLAGQNSFC